MADPVERALLSGQRLLDAAAEAQGAGAPAQAQRLTGRAIRTLRRALGPQDPNLAPAWLSLAHLRGEAEDLRGAARAGRRAVALLAPWRRDDEILILFLEATVSLAHDLIALARFTEAATRLKPALRLARRRLGPQAPLTGELQNALGKLCKYTSRTQAGLRYYRGALGIFEAHGLEAQIATVQHNLGGLLHEAGRFAEALPHAEHALALRVALTGEDSLESEIERAALAPILADLGRVEEAVAIQERLVTVFRGLDRRYDLAVALHNLATCAPPQAAAPLYEESIVIKTSLLGGAHPDVALSRRGLQALRP